MQNDVNADIERVLTQYRTVAIVGASYDPKRPSHRVAKFLKGEGYRIIPVTPKAERILEETSYPDLRSIPEQVEIVDVFRRSEHVLPIAEEAIAIGAKVLWMQEGIINEEAAAKAAKAGLTVIMGRLHEKGVPASARPG